MKLNKRLLTTLTFLIFCSIASAQDKPLIFTEVVQVDSTLSKNTLFDRARAWLNDVFKDYKEVSQIQDRDAGELSVKGIIFTHYLKNGFGQPLPDYPCYVRCKITIWVKDGRYKYEFSDYYDECNRGGGAGQLTERETYKESGMGKNSANEYWKETKSGATSKTKELIALLNAAMNKANTANDDW